MVSIEILHSASATDLNTITCLMHQLSSKASDLNISDLHTILNSPSSVVFCARNTGSGQITGVLLLTWYKTLSSGTRFWIEDVVVDEKARGMGTGRNLVQSAVAFARQQHPEAGVMLTSNPSRTEARALYRSLGFHEYDTSVFRL